MRLSDERFPMNDFPMNDSIPVTRDLLRSMPLPHPGDSADKDGRGRVLVIGGSVEVPGAVLLAGTAALRAGAGKLQIDRKSVV